MLPECSVYCPRRAAKLGRLHLTKALLASLFVRALVDHRARTCNLSEMLNQTVHSHTQTVHSHTQTVQIPLH